MSRSSPNRWSIGPADDSADGQTLPLQPEYGDLWTRIRQGFVLTDLDTADVKAAEAWYAARPDYVARMVERSRRYLYYIVGEVQKRGMPTEIALLPMIESAYNPMAYSRSRASGIWQFIPSTGKDFGLKQNWWFDERRDVVAATDGALDYLEKLYAEFGDWYLALAAYNWGEGSVRRAIAANAKRGLPTDYLSLKMPAETRQYVPKLQAVKNIVNDPESLRAGACRHSGRAVLHRGAHDQEDGRQEGGGAGGDAGRRVSLAQPAAQPAGHRRRGRDDAVAALRQGGAVCGEAGAVRSTDGDLAGVQDETWRDAGAGRCALRAAPGDAAHRQRHRRARQRGAGGPRAAGAVAGAIGCDGGDAAGRRVHYGAERPHRLPSGRQRRDAGFDRRPLRRHAAGPQIVEWRADGEGRRRPETARRHRCGPIAGARPARKKTGARQVPRDRASKPAPPARTATRRASPQPRQHP